MAATSPLGEKKVRPSGSRYTADRKNQTEWHFIHAWTCRKFRLGEIVGKGELLGLSVSGKPVYADAGGRVSGIQYDLWREEVILEVTLSIPA